MTAEEREELHDLYVMSRNAHERAVAGEGTWALAHATEQTFITALYSVDVTP